MLCRKHCLDEKRPYFLFCCLCLNRLLLDKINRNKAGQTTPLLSLVAFRAVSILLVFLSGVMIFVHPADSRAQPSVQAALPLIGPEWGYGRRGQSSKLIGQDNE